jgi:hypothetical protein
VALEPSRIHIPDVEEHMNRIAKNVQSLVLAAMLFVAGAYLGARAVSHGAVAAKQVHNGIMLVDGGPKPCSSC